MGTQRLPRALLRVACATLAMLVSACWDAGYDDPEPQPPPTAYVSIDDRDTRTEGTAAWLEGEAECPDCTSTDWQYGSCPEITCPTQNGEVRWTNLTTGAAGSATHGAVPACHCPWPWGYGYCYSACSHVWWTSVPLEFGDNDIVVSATMPGYAEGSAAILIQRVPATPSWLPPVAGAGQVTLSWTASEGATSYNLYWSTIPYAWASLCTKLENVTSPYTQTGLAGGVPHYYYVTALAGEVEGFDSVRLTATPD